MPLPPRAVGLKSFPGYDQLPATYKYDPAKAKALLSEAGFPNGLDIGPLSYWFLNQAWENQTLLIQDMLKKVGITATPRKMDRTEFLNLYLKAEPWDGALMQHSTNPGVSSQAWAEWAFTGAPNNYWGISDPQLDAIITRLRTELNETARQALFKQFQDQETAQVHRVWVNQLATMTATRRYVINGTGSFLTYKQPRLMYQWLDK